MSGQGAQLPRIDNHNSDTEEWFKALTEGYPSHPEFIIDYSEVSDCPIVSCAVFYGDEVLLALRGPNVIEYPNTWATLGGFLTQPDPVIAAQEELEEEVGINQTDIESITVARRRIRLDPTMRVTGMSPAQYRRRWHEYRCAVVLRRKVLPSLNWENTKAGWMTLRDLDTLSLLPSSRPIDSGLDKPDDSHRAPVGHSSRPTPRHHRLRSGARLLHLAS